MCNFIIYQNNYYTVYAVHFFNFLLYYIQKQKLNMDKEMNGGNFIPASQRPDGTWRKPRRVKEGYVPQEEVPLYESKGKQFLTRKTQLPAGLPPNITPHRSIPGLFIEEDKNKKEKKKTKQAVQEVTKSLAKVNIIETPAQIDPAKRLKNLRKRLREIEALEQKIHAGDIKKPEKEQLEKVARKKEVIKEIRIIEASVNSN